MKASDLLSEAELVKALQRALEIDATYAFLTLKEILFLVDPKLSNKEIAKVIEQMDNQNSIGLEDIAEVMAKVLPNADCTRSHGYCSVVVQSLKRHTEGEVFIEIRVATNHKKIVRQLQKWIAELS